MVQESHKHWLTLLAQLNERQARLCVAEKALSLGHGGIAQLALMTGMNRQTIRKGIRELRAGIPEAEAERIRQQGGGRKRVELADPQVLQQLAASMEETTAGDPMSALRWTNKSTRRLAEELTSQGHPIHANTVGRLLQLLGFSLRANVKSKSAAHHADRDAQFRYINRLAKRFQRAQQPVISVDTKKQEKVGDFKNPGRTYRRTPQHVNAYDFPHLARGKAIPYGIYDVYENVGMVNVGITRDTAEFAVDSIERWWRRLGKRRHAQANQLLICADGGGSNGTRNRLWKARLQDLADRTGLTLTVCHYPPGTSKWNKIEHRMFSFISINWQGQPLESYETVVQLINGTTTTSGLKVHAELCVKEYERGLKVSDEEMEGINIRRHRTHPQWNYTIRPNRH
jgi:transposase